MGNKRIENKSFAGEPRSNTPTGEYIVICYKTRPVQSFGGKRRLELWFRVIEGNFEGDEILMYCTFPSGRLSRSCKLYEQWVLAIGRTPTKGERFNRKVFQGKMFKLLVRKTNCKYKNRILKPTILQYSVADTILETLTGII